jgi:hypothetical protein
VLVKPPENNYPLDVRGNCENDAFKVLLKIKEKRDIPER